MREKSELSLVSVIIPTFNSRDSVFNAIESVLSQTYKNLEIIVVNDGKVKGLNEVINNRYPEVTLYHDGINRGGGGARNVGIRIARGNYVCFLDDDDTYLPDKIEKLMLGAKLFPDFDAYFGVILGAEPSIFSNRSYCVEVRFINRLCFLHTNSSLIRRSVFNSISFCEDLKKYQDTQFHAELIANFKLLIFNFPVACWNKNISQDQITRLSNPRDYYYSFKRFQEMISFLSKRNIGLLNMLYFRLKGTKYFFSAIIKGALSAYKSWKK